MEDDSGSTGVGSLEWRALRKLGRPDLGAPLRTGNSVKVWIACGTPALDVRSVNVVQISAALPLASAKAQVCVNGRPHQAGLAEKENLAIC